MTAVGIEAIAKGSNWSQLKHFNLSVNKIDDEGYQILAQWNWPLLETLILQDMRMSSFALEAIAKRSNWPQLKHLDISLNEVNDQGIQLLSYGNWPLLETLNLEKTEMPTVGVEAIVKGSNWSQLKYLNLPWNKIDDESLEILALGNWPLLETLNLGSTRVTKKGLLNLIFKTKWSSLKEIICVPISEDFTKSLFKENWHCLEKLDLSSSEITQHEIEAIVNKFPQLKHLDLSDNPKINDEALQILTQASWPLLETLNLEETNITKEKSLSFLWNTNWPKFIKITLPVFWDFISQNLALSFIQKDLSQVEKLELTHLNPAYITLETIVNQHQCPKLKHLNISNSDISFEEFSGLTLAEVPFLEELHLEDTKIPLKGIEKIASQSKWPQLKHLNISNNKIFDKGILALSLAKWQLLEDLNLKNTRITAEGIKIIVSKMNLPHLKKLNVSENSILDEGLETISSGDWPSFEHLVFSNTKVTLKGNITLLEKFKWPNLHKLENSLSESFYNYNKSSPEIILAAVPMYYKGQSLFVMVLNMTWLDSKEIDLLMDYSGLKKKSILMPHDKWHQLEGMNLSPSTSPNQSIMWPSSLKMFSISNSSLSDERNVENLFLKNCPQLECMNLHRTGLTTKGIEILSCQSNWAGLRKLDISGNLITKEGLEILVSAKWKKLEELNLENTNLTFEGIKIVIAKSDWPDLKKWDVSNNQIQNEGLERLTAGKWHSLEDLNLKSTCITAEGIKVFINKDWPKLKKLDVSDNPIQNKGLELLSSKKWPELESLNLRSTRLTEKGIKGMANLSDWPSLKILDSSSNYDIFRKGIEALVLGKWPLLERLFRRFHRHRI